MAWNKQWRNKHVSPLLLLCSLVPLDLAFPWKGTAATIASKDGAGPGRRPGAPTMPTAMMFLGICIARSLLRPRIPLDRLVSAKFPLALNGSFAVSDWNLFHRNLTFSNRADQLPEDDLRKEYDSGRLGSRGSSREAVLLKYPPKMF